MRRKRKRRTGEHLHMKKFCFLHKGGERGLQKPLIEKHITENVHADRVWNTAPRLKIRNKTNETSVKIRGRLTSRMLRERRKQ